MQKVVAVAVVLATAIVLLVPFHPEAFLLHAIDAATPDSALQRGINWFVVESGGNFAMFALLGAALRCFVRSPLRAAAIGIGISGAAELAQIVIPQRVPSMTDFITNAIGTAVGVAVAHAVAARHRARSTAASTSADAS